MSTWNEYFNRPGVKPRVTTFKASPKERANFCYHCGLILPPGNTCPGCGAIWERLFVAGVEDKDGRMESACPKCPPTAAAWQHLFAPMSANGNGSRVFEAVGLAQCESEHALLYVWTPVEVTFIGGPGTRSVFSVEDIKGQS